MAERRAEREQLRTERGELHGALRQTREQLEAWPRWAHGRRRSLTDVTHGQEQQLRQTEPTLAGLVDEIDRLSRRVGRGEPYRGAERDRDSGRSR